MRGEIKFSSVALRKGDQEGTIDLEYIINSDPKGYIMASIFQTALRSVVYNHVSEWTRLVEAA